MIEDQPVSFVGDVMECGIRDCVRLVHAVGDEHVSVGIAVPYMHGDLDVFEAKSPGSPFERDVLHAGAARSRRKGPSDVGSNGDSDVRCVRLPLHRRPGVCGASI